MHVIVVVIVCLMLARMWSCGIELHLYDHDVSVACINGARVRSAVGRKYPNAGGETGHVARQEVLVHLRHQFLLRREVRNWVCASEIVFERRLCVGGALAKPTVAWENGSKLLQSARHASLACLKTCDFHNDVFKARL